MRIEPLPYLIIACVVVMLGALSFVSNTLADRQHKAQHEAINAAVIAEAETHCPAGTRITIIEAGKKTCLTENRNGYSKADRREFVAAQ